MLLKKEGFHRLMDLLYDSDGKKIPLRDFFKDYNQVSYYNSFYRVKKELLKLGIIEIRDKTIRLTNRGQVVASLYVALKQRLERD